MKDQKDLGDGNGNGRFLSKDVTPGIFPEISPSKRFSSRSAELRRRSKRMSQSRGLSALKDPFVAEFEPSAFSDEYDLCEFHASACILTLTVRIHCNVAHEGKYNDC